MKSPMWERSGVASKGIVGGAIPKSSCRTRLVFMTITNTTMRTWQGQGESCVSVYCRLRKQMLSSRTSRLLRSRRLSASHKGRFKGSHLLILCKIQLLEFHRNFCVLRPISIHVGDCWKIGWQKWLLTNFGHNYLYVCVIYISNSL